VNVDHWPPSSAKVKNECSHTSTSHYAFTAWAETNLPSFRMKNLSRRSTQSQIRAARHVGLCAKFPLFLPDFNQKWNISKNLFTSFLNEVIPLCINSIYLIYHILPSTQHTSFEFTATCFDLTSHLQA
jgi:hypothetical protein